MVISPPQVFMALRYCPGRELLPVFTMEEILPFTTKEIVSPYE
jgi:hypothetical protein